MFKDGTADRSPGRVRFWWLWDAEKERKTGSLTDAQQKFPIRAVLNDTMLNDRIKLLWNPEADAE